MGILQTFLYFQWFENFAICCLENDDDPGNRYPEDNKMLKATVSAAI
jgi:hypothetical protein